MESLNGTLIAHTNRMVLTCTGLSDRAQNELYLLSRSLQAVLVRDKALGGKLFDYQTSHLVVGTLAKTDKLLCGLAAGTVLYCTVLYLNVLYCNTLNCIELLPVLYRAA